MSKRTMHSFFRKLLSLWVVMFMLLLIALVTFIIGYLLQISLLQGLGGVFGGVTLSLFITLVTSKEAVKQQNAKEANITRKYTYYIPIFNELKQIYDILEEARHKMLPYPQWIKVSDMKDTPMVWHKYPMPGFTQWIAFKEEPYRSNFTDKAYKLFNEVQESSSHYNETVNEAKDPVVKILNSKIDSAFREWANGADFKQWKEETNGGNISSSNQYHEWNLYVYRYFQRPVSGVPPEAQAFVWAHNILGWVLADDIDKASNALQGIYQNDFQTRFTPDTMWFKNILESAWTEMQELPQVKRVHKEIADLFVATMHAKDYVQSRLTYIRDMYEGGEPPL